MSAPLVAQRIVTMFYEQDTTGSASGQGIFSSEKLNKSMLE
jgi:hypothetical protein